MIFFEEQEEILDAASRLGSAKVGRSGDGGKRLVVESRKEEDGEGFVGRG